MTTVLSDTKQAKPFLKWAGGKGQLIDDIDRRLPHDLKSGKIKTYIEPFIGGGAVFFHIAQKYEALKKYILMDINQDLVACYNHIKYKVEALIDELKYLEEQYFSAEAEERNDLFLKVRIEFNHEKEDTTPKRSAKLIFLNRTCFNGLYRVNRKGDFNVPFGKYSKPAICSEHNLSGPQRFCRMQKLSAAIFLCVRNTQINILLCISIRLTGLFQDRKFYILC
jgi:DNA adenine methylase